jgi:hypothetical protein
MMKRLAQRNVVQIIRLEQLDADRVQLFGQVGPTRRLEGDDVPPELLLNVRRQSVGLVGDHATVGGGRRLCFQSLDQFVRFVAAIVCRHDDDDDIVVERKSTSAQHECYSRSAIRGLLAAAAVERL